jgi:hypothetical protein
MKAADAAIDPYGFMVGARRWTRRMIERPFTGIISVNNAFTRFEVWRRKWLLPPFVRTTTPDPVTPKRLEVALWVFIFNLPCFCLRGTANSSRKKFRGIDLHPRMTTFLNPLPKRSLYFFFPFVGASSINMLRPSRAGGDSTIDISASYSATSFKSTSARSR